MIRFLLIAALALPAAAFATPHPARGDRSPAAARTRNPSRSPAPAARRSPSESRRHDQARSKARIETRVVIAPTGRAARAPSRHRHDHFRRSRPAPVYRSYAPRPRWRPVVVIVDHDLVYDRIARAERRMSHLEGRAAHIQDWRERGALERESSDLHADLARLDRDADRIRSWYHWERSLDRIRSLRHRLGAVDADIAAGPVRRVAPPAARPRHYAVDAVQFAKIEHELEAATFRDDKLRVVRRIVQHHWFTSAQAQAVARKMHFSDDKVAALTLLHPRVVDPENFEAAFSELPHRSDRQELEAAIYAGN